MKSLTPQLFNVAAIFEIVVANGVAVLFLIRVAMVVEWVVVITLVLCRI